MYFPAFLNTDVPNEEQREAFECLCGAISQTFQLHLCESPTHNNGCLMVIALDSRSGGPGSSPGRGHCVVFLGKTLYSHSASLHPCVQMGTSKCAGGNPAMD